MPLQSHACTCRAADGQSLFDFTVQDANGADVKLESFRGAKAYVVVNVATK
jgi:glutathione peroxidase-family protein